MSKWVEKVCRSVVTAITVLTMTSCATGFNRLYEGPPKTQDQVAFLISDGNEIFSPTVVADTVDSKPVIRSDWDGRWKCELLPGPHTVTVRYFKSHGDYFETSDPVMLHFTAEAGRTYFVDRGLGDHTWNPSIDYIRCR